MTQLKPVEILNLVRQVGFPSDVMLSRPVNGREIPVDVCMTCIALRESDGCCEVHNTSGPDDSYGLTQINLKSPDIKRCVSQKFFFGIANPDFTKLFDPTFNLTVAHALALSEGSAHLEHAMTELWAIWQGPTLKNRIDYYGMWVSHLPEVWEAVEELKNSGSGIS